MGNLKGTFLLWVDKAGICLDIGRGITKIVLYKKTKVRAFEDRINW